MGNSSSMCSDKKSFGNYTDSGPPIYPSSNSSVHNSTERYGKLRHNEENDRVYKTTIPVNSHRCDCECCNHLASGFISNETNQTADVSKSKIEQIEQIEHGVPYVYNHVSNRFSLKQAPPPLPMRNAASGSGTHTCKINNQPISNTTTVEYELSNGVVKLCKISSSRIATAEESSVSSLKQQQQKLKPGVILPTLLSSNDIKELNKSLETISAEYNRDNTEISTDFYNKERKMNFKRDRLGMLGTDNDIEVSGNLSGLDHFNNKKYNKGLAFTLEERQSLGIHGFFPAVVKSLDEQMAHCHMLLDQYENDLHKYMYLHDLADRNERLFYNLLASNIDKMMPLVYTPTVGLACQKFSMIYTHPKGLFITIKDKGHVYDVLRNWPETDVRAIVVTDGQRILGLGDLGANGMGIPVGKLALYTALCRIKPHQCLPITLDVGTNTQSILDDPLYVGLRQKRVSGEKYYEFIEEFMNAVVRRFGQNCLVQFEDFGNANAFELLDIYRDTHCVFNDDIQGTAAVCIAGILASLRIKNTKFKDHTILFQGAGEASIGIAQLCLYAMERQGMSKEEAKKHIWLVDSKGLIVENRPKGGIDRHKAFFAQKHAPIDTLEEAVKAIKPTVLIGAAAIPGAFTPVILETMAKNCDTPVIFALSNPTSKAECTAEDAYKYTKGKVYFASGSPFEPVVYEGETFYTGQGNNAYIFPGVALGVICSGMLTIPDEIFLMSAEKLASLCSDDQIKKGLLYPPKSKMSECSFEIAAQIMDYAYKNGLATVRPEPKDKLAFMKAQSYELDYPSAIPEVYEWC